MPESILIVEKNVDLRQTLQRAFEDRGYLAWTCRTPGMAVSIFETVRPKIVILDFDFGGDSILALLDIWKDQAPGTRVIVESAAADAEQMRSAMAHGACAFLVKPYTMEPLFDLLEKDIPPGPPVRQAA